MPSPVFTEIVHDTLVAVTFNGSGVVLDFGDAWFKAHTWPSVRMGNRTLQLGESGYRDALCAFIDHEVSSVDESPNDGLVIAFGLGSIVINPEPSELSGPEIAQLAIHDPMAQLSHVAVWRPGEEPFIGSAWA
jgi:hypothetical protein